jgi:hypothetical protein
MLQLQRRYSLATPSSSLTTWRSATPCWNRMAPASRPSNDGILALVTDAQTSAVGRYLPTHDADVEASGFSNSRVASPEATGARRMGARRTKR